MRLNGPEGQRLNVLTGEYSENLTAYLRRPEFNIPELDLGIRLSTTIKGLDWVICGGETGPGARPMHPDWVRSLRDQCQAAGAPFFFKGWGNMRTAFTASANAALAACSTGGSGTNFQEETMTFDEFMQTKFFGFLFCCLAFAMTCYFVWKTGYACGYQNGIEDNPKNREVHTYIYNDGRMLRFVPGIDRSIIIDPKNNKAMFVPIEPEQNQGDEYDR